MRSRTLHLPALAVSAVLLAGLTGCGSGDDAACNDIKKAITDVSSKGLQQVSDPTALAKTYSDGAATIRAKANGAGGDVKEAGNKAADAMETLGRQVGALSSSDSTTPQMPDTAALTNAGKDLQDACS